MAVSLPETDPDTGDGGAIEPWPTLPAAAYLDPDVLEREQAQILRRTWQLAGHESDLPDPGDFLVFDLLGESAIVIRGNDGVVRAFHNVCRHRGTRLLEGCGRSPARIRCRYHGFSYALDGHLAAVPGEADFVGLEKTAMPLRPVALDCWQGFVFLRFDESASGPTIAEQLAPLATVLAAYHLEDLRPLGGEGLTAFSCNWKIAVENNIEGYHIPVGHPGLQRLYGERYDFATLPLGVSHAGAGLPDNDEGLSWSERTYLRLLPETGWLPPGRRRAWHYLSLFPNLAFDLYPDQVDFFQILPLAPNRCVTRSRAYGLPDDRREMQAARYLNQRINRLVAAEDRHLVEGVQRGLASSGYRQGLLSRREARVRQFQLRWREAMGWTESQMQGSGLLR